MNGGRFRYAGSHGVPTGTVSQDEDVMRGRIVFDDGTSVPLSYYRFNGRKVERFEMDGMTFNASAGYEELVAVNAEITQAMENIEQACEDMNELNEGLVRLVREMWLIWKRLDLEGDWPHSGHNGWKVFVKQMVELGIWVDDDDFQAMAEGQ